MQTQKRWFHYLITSIMVSGLFQGDAKGCSSDEGFALIWLSTNCGTSRWPPWEHTDQADPYRIPPNPHDQLPWLEGVVDGEFCSYIDKIMQWNKSGNPTHQVVINFLDGEYYTAGIRINSGIDTAVKLRGASRAGTVIRFQNYRLTPRFNAVNTTAILAPYDYPVGWVEVCQMTVDASWEYNWSRVNPRPWVDNGFKVGGVQLVACKAWVHDVEVKGTGASGANWPPGADHMREVFPLVLAKNRYSVAEDYAPYEPGDHHLKITECVVQPIVGIAGPNDGYPDGVGYGTGINITTLDDPGGSTSMAIRFAIWMSSTARRRSFKAARSMEPGPRSGPTGAI